MGADAIAALATAVSLIIGSIGGVIVAVATLVGALRKKDTAPAPQIGIPATVPTTADDIDFRAYEDMRADRDMWRARALRDANHIDEDTQPLDPT